MKYQFIEDHRNTYPVQRMCAVLEVSSSGYYAWRDRAPSQRTQENRELAKHMQIIHDKARHTYGSPRIHAKLLKQGFQVSRGRVQRLMKANGIEPRRRKRYKKITTNSKHSYPVAQNLLDQDFTAAAPNLKWVADISYIPTQEGWLYLAAVMDLYSRRIVGWAMDAYLEATFVEDALKMAIHQRRPGSDLLHHSDRGSQYACHDYQDLLKAHGILPSMSRTGNCYDNAVMESFFGSLKTECVHHCNYPTRNHAKRDVFEYIEVFYNRERIHSTLGYLSPHEYEALWSN
jgi:transposase InsO family protein